MSRTIGVDPIRFRGAIAPDDGMTDVAGGVSESEIADEAVTREKLSVNTRVSLGTPIDADPDRIVTVIDIADGAQSLAAQPDNPRNLTITVVDANTSITAGTITIVGTDPAGNAVQEVLTLPTLTLTGTKIFAEVTSVTVADLAGEAAGDTIVVGVGDVIGLPTDITATAAIKNVAVAEVPVTPDAIAVGASTSGIDVNGATLDGSKEIVVHYDVGA